MNRVSSRLLFPEKFLFFMKLRGKNNKIPYIFTLNLGLFFSGHSLFLIYVYSCVDYEKNMQMFLNANPKPIASRKPISFLPRGALNS